MTVWFTNEKKVIYFWKMVVLVQEMYKEKIKMVTKR